MHWLGNAAHNHWLESETDRLLSFARGARQEGGGFGWLDDRGVLTPGKPTELWITCRMTHVFAIGAAMGRPGCMPLVEHGVKALRTVFADEDNGGWYSAIDQTGPVDATKAAYAHAFVILASSSAAAVGAPGAEGLLENALATHSRYFWDEEVGMAREQWNRDFTECDPYRGVNANMHTVEGYLAAANVTGDSIWLQRATRIITRVVSDFAANNNWRIPEHFDTNWNPDLEYNADNPGDQFRPYGATIGHWLEWARLTLHARAALGESAPDWMLPNAKSLFEAAITEGWAADGADGFVYTVDWSGKPVVRQRLHWVLAEALGAAATLYRASGEETYQHWYATWWDYAHRYLLDFDGGSWRHELDASNAPAATIWEGKSDIYHAIQSTVIPRLPLNPVLVPALADGLLDS